MLAHLLTFLGFAVALGSFIPPLVILLLKQEESDFVADQAKEALNFQITVLIAGIAWTVLLLTGVFACVAIPLMILTALGDIVLVIMAAVSASQGEAYRYPFAFRFVR
jgi:uncharacterized Tic20 family protein